MKTGVTYNENRVFPVGIDSQGVPCEPYRVWVCSEQWQSCVGQTKELGLLINNGSFYCIYQPNTIYLLVAQDQKNARPRNSCIAMIKESMCNVCYLTQSLVGFIYTFWYSLWSTSSILEQGFQSIHHSKTTSLEGFQQHFSIISKSVCCCFYVKKNVAFALIFFVVLK